MPNCSGLLEETPGCAERVVRCGSGRVFRSARFKWSRKDDYVRHSDAENPARLRVGADPWKAVCFGAFFHSCIYLFYALIIMQKQNKVTQAKVILSRKQQNKQ